MIAPTEPRPGLERAAQVFLGGVIGVGVIVIAASLYELHSQPVGYRWYMLAALTLVSGSATVTLPSVPASISVSETFVFASVLLFGSAAGTLTVALDGLVISFWMAKRRPEWYRALFNMTAPAVAIWFASQLLFTIAHIQPLTRQPVSVNTLLVPLVLFAIVYFGLNSWLIAFAVAFETRASAYRIWRENFLWLSLNYFSGASVALLLVVYTRDVDLRFIGVIIPLLLVLYFTFKTSMGRVADANSHLQQLNRLYLSTIETLAMAIDAKDQITHGHIRRVQSLAVGLARTVGVMDENLIKAIEAAALLHDTGKLAVPEYILNKPGKLTAAEFEKMKLHVTVGADILTGVDFPYPVVPIVRHHHENWNGTGYPDGLRGTDIPIGARILSVVDCFDALTSDRPYRPRLSNDDAMRILFERRGSMYDPLIVDTFARVYRETAPQSFTIEQTRHALDEITSSSYGGGVVSSTPSLDEIAASTDEMLSLYQLASALARQTETNGTGDVIARHLPRMIPCALAVLYSYDASTDELEAKHSVGDSGLTVSGLRIALGQRLSGWVAANRQTIMNSDPVLDLGDIARSASPRLKSCLSTPLLIDGQLVGALTLYSGMSEAFNHNHKRLIEIVAPQLAHSLRREAENVRAGSHDVLTEVHELDQLQNFLDSGVSMKSPNHVTRSLLTITVLGLKQIGVLYNRASGDELLRYVVRGIRTCLRPGDMLFRNGADQFVAVLRDSDATSAAALVRRIRDEVRRRPFAIQPHSTVTVDVNVAAVSPTDSGSSLSELISLIRARSRSDIARDTSSVH